MDTFAKRLRSALEKKGWSQEDVEAAADLSKGYLSRLLDGSRQNPTGKTLMRLAAVLDADYAWLSRGGTPADGARQSTIEGLPPTLEQIQGYADAEIVVARQLPKVPVEVFRDARGAQLARPPKQITPEFLRDFVEFLWKQHGVNDETPTVENQQKSRTRNSKRAKRI